MSFLIFFLFSLVACFIIVTFLFLRGVAKKKLFESLDVTLFLVRLPLASKEGKDPLKEIQLGEQFLSSLASFGKPCVFEVAVPSVGEEIHFYVAVSSGLREPLERQIHAFWPEADVAPAEDYNIFNPAGAVSAVSLKQKDNPFIPVRTYQETGADTFQGMLGGLSKINQVGEGGILQYIVRPASPEIKKSIQSALHALREGKNPKEVLGKSSFGGEFKKIFAGNKKKDETPKPVILDEVLIKALEAKLSKPLFEANVRVVSSAPSQMQSDTILDGITAGFSQFSAPNRNEFVLVRQKNINTFIRAFSFRSFSSDQSMLLTSEELASVFHFPTPFTNVPRIKYLKSKEAPPPPDIPNEGLVIGQSVYRGEKRPVRITREDRRRHVYIVGQTGTGKSVLLQNLSDQDIKAGEGVCVIDPNGDLIEDVLSRVPKERMEDVVVFDPSNLDRSLGLNMLEYDPLHSQQKTFIVNELLSIFDTLYNLKTTGGPMFEQYMRYALLLLMDDPTEPVTLVDVPRVFSDVTFRRRLLEKCNDLLTKNFWEKEAEKAGGEASLANITPYITSKFNTFIANDYVRPIISQAKSSLRFREMMDQGKILLVNLSKGRIGDINASLLGMIIVGKLTMAAFARQDVRMEDRKDFYLYIDEFQNFITPSISTILSEARKYRLSLTFAHQFIGQLSDEIKRAVFGNVGSLISFRVGPEDAEFLVKQFEPTFNANDLVNIDNLHAHAKVMMRDQVAKPFTLFVPFPEKGNQEVIAHLKELSALKYGRPRAEVEEEMRGRLKT